MRARTVWRVARWEVLGGRGGLDRRAIAVSVGLVVLLGLLLPVAASTGPAPDDGLYRVGIDGASPYRAPAEAAPVFDVVAPDEAAFRAGDLDLLVVGTDVRVRDAPTGRAAAGALRSAVERYNDRRMADEPDQAAAFPVLVELRYVERDVGLLVRRAGTGGSAGGDDGGDGAGDDGTDGDDGTVGTPEVGGAGAGDGGGFGSLGALPGGGALFPQTSTGTPADIAPPFPFGSLVLAFAFVVPMNFVVQAYASSVLHDRGNRRGEPLLVAPVSRWSLIAGKALPYLAAMVGLSGVTALAVGGGALSLLAAVPIALVFLAAAFLAGLLARSHKELTFVLVAVSVGVTSYVFVPAIFADVHPIAAISPLSLVVSDLEGTAVSAGTVAFSTLPAVLAAGVLFGLGAGLYREEDLFTQRPLPEKALDALAAFVTSPRRAGWASLLAIPFVFLAELLVVASLFLLPLSLALPVLFAAVAVVEELAKSLPAYAGFVRGRYDRSIRTSLAVGAWSGLGFFVGEKAAAVAQLVGLFDLEVGRVAFELGAGLGGVSSPGLLAVLLVAPLGLHVLTATTTALGAARGARTYALALAVAIAVHAAYNVMVVVLLA